MIRILINADSKHFVIEVFSIKADFHFLLDQKKAA